MLLSDDELNAMQVEIDDWKARAEAAEAELARVRAGEPFGWYSAKEDDFMLDKIRKTHERLNSHTHRIGKYDTALFTAPQPAAQEQTSAVPVVEQLLSALMYHRDQTRPINTTTEAIAAGQQYLKESGK